MGNLYGGPWVRTDVAWDPPGSFPRRRRSALPAAVLVTGLVALLWVGSLGLPDVGTFRTGGRSVRPDRTSRGAGPGVSPSASLGVVLNLSNVAPVARQKVNLTAIVSGGTPPYTCTWTFGDGTGGSNCTTSHTWLRSGAYKVTVTVSDSATGTTSKSIAITVANPPPPGGGSSGLSPSQVWEIVIGLLVVGVVVLFVAILLQRRSRPPPT